MSKPLMIYERTVPVSSERHLDWSVSVGDNYSFARSTNTAPLLANEFAAAANEFLIVFTGEEDNIITSCVLGIRKGENTYVSRKNTWLGQYIPAFFRRYPFVFSTNKIENSEQLTLCIDEEFNGFNNEDRGERLFDSEGQRSFYLKKMLEFCKEFQAQYNTSVRFAQHMHNLGILEPTRVKFKAADGKLSALAGFKTINREKLKNLPGHVLVDMTKTQELDLCYLHLQSLSNLERLIERTSF